MTIADPIPEEAVEAAYRGYCEARKGKPLAPGEYEATYSRVEAAWMRAALTAAAPYIAAQATADLRAGIEALRDEWRIRATGHHTNAVSPDFTGTVNAVLGGMASSHADALDALLRGAK